MSDEQTVTSNSRIDRMGIEGLPITLDYPYPNNATIGILLVNLQEAFRRIEQQQREIDALKRVASSQDVRP